MKKLLPAFVIAALVGFYLWRGKSRPQLRYFTASEFGPYWPLMNAELLQLIDAFRHELGYPVAISPVPGAIGRPVIGADQVNQEEKNSGSWHNWFTHGQVYAIDLMPMPPGGATAAERQRWRDVARRLGARGIGIYPDWKPRPGIHLDMRTDRTADNPAEWAGVLLDGKQVLVGINRGLV